MLNINDYYIQIINVTSNNIFPVRLVDVRVVDAKNEPNELGIREVTII